MPSRIDTAVHTKVFDYPVAGHWGGGEMFSPARTRTDNTSAHIINDISSCLGEAKYKLYADDTVVYTDCPPAQTMVPVLQTALNNLTIWCNENQLIVSIKKTKCMTFGSKNNL